MAHVLSLLYISYILTSYFVDRVNTYNFELETFLGAFAKFLKVTVSACLSVRSHGTALLPLDGFSLNLMFMYFSKICREN